VLEHNQDPISCIIWKPFVSNEDICRWM